MGFFGFLQACLGHQHLLVDFWVMYEEAKKLVKLLHLISPLAFNQVFPAISEQGSVFPGKH